MFMFNSFSDHTMKYIVVPYEMHNILKLICCGQAAANKQIFEITEDWLAIVMKEKKEQ